NSAGFLVRQLPSPSPQSYVDIRGIEYAPDTDKIFVAQLGSSSFNYRVMRIDGPTGALEDDISFHYADDLFITTDSNLLVGSRTQPPRIYSQDLVQIGEVDGTARLFVTECPPLNQCGN